MTLTTQELARAAGISAQRVLVLKGQGYFKARGIVPEEVRTDGRVWALRWPPAALEALRARPKRRRWLDRGKR